MKFKISNILWATAFVALLLFCLMDCSFTLSWEETPTGPDGSEGYRYFHVACHALNWKWDYPNANRMSPAEAEEIVGDVLEEREARVEGLWSPGTTAGPVVIDGDGIPSVEGVWYEDDEVTRDGDYYVHKGEKYLKYGDTYYRADEYLELKDAE